MEKRISPFLPIPLLACIILFSCSQEKEKNDTDKHSFNGDYTGKYLDRVSFPIGGIGAGMFCMDGTGSLSHLSINNKPEIFNEPFSFAAISIKGCKDGAKVLEAQVPEWKMFGPAGSGNGGAGRNYGLPRFENGRFLPRFPFASLELEDSDIPLDVEITGWSPFIPTDADNSSLPVGAMEYKFKNNSSAEIDAVFSWNSRNIISGNVGRILSAKNGFVLTKNNNDGSPLGTTGFSATVHDNNYCWFRGEWFDPHMILWENIESCRMPDNKPVETPAPGASIFVPFKLKPGEEKTVVVKLSWYLPETHLTIGVNPASDAKMGFYKPWYSGKFKNLNEISEYWSSNYSDIKRKSELFRDAFFC